MHANLLQSALFMTSAMSLVLLAVGSVMMVQDRTEEALRRSEARLSFRSRVFERLADGLPLADLMDVLCRELAQIQPHLRGLVMARDVAGTLRPMAGPLVPAPLMRAIEALGSAGGVAPGETALAAGRQEVVADIAAEPAWAPLHAAAREAGVRACWTFPVTLSDGQRPAAILVVLDQPRAPEPAEAELLASGARLVAIAFERHAAAERLATSERHYRLVVENAQEGICVVQDQVLRFVNQRHAELLGRSVADLVGCHIAEHTHPEDLARGLQNDRLRQAGGGAEQDYDLRLLTRHRGVRWFRMSGTPFTWEGRPATLNFFTDVTERRELEERIRHLAFHDALTNLPNRRLLLDRLNLGVARSRRSGAHGALVFLDLDRFKALNDRHGHEAGDRFLVEVSRRLRESVRETDTVARFGGDEFVVLLGDLPTELDAAREDVRRIARKLLDRLGEPYRLPGPDGAQVEHLSTASVGAVMFDDADVDVDTLMSSADSAMYRAKQAGGDRLCLLDPGRVLSMPA
jgi:diguanylate cyclase (GGDEF)-like protein/PAS domain S-box-containing protein